MTLQEEANVRKVADYILDSAIAYIKFDTEMLTIVPLALVCMNHRDTRIIGLLIYLGKRFETDTKIIKLDGSELEKASKGLETYLHIMTHKNVLQKIDEKTYKVITEDWQKVFADAKKQRLQELEKIVVKVKTNG